MTMRVSRQPHGSACALRMAGGVPSGRRRLPQPAERCNAR